MSDGGRAHGVPPTGTKYTQTQFGVEVRQSRAFDLRRSCQSVTTVPDIVEACVDRGVGFRERIPFYGYAGPNSKDSPMQTDSHFAAKYSIACISASTAGRRAPPIPLIVENPWCAGTL
jgi:hypothetical protein